MEDERIIELFWQRDESAVAELQCKYFPFCTRIAVNLLSDGQDAEECVNDALLEAWNSIPPQRPDNLKAWLGRVVRNKSIDLWKKNHAKKRYSGLTQALDELEDSVPYPRNMEQELEDKAQDSAVERWLRSLTNRERKVFIRRYWYGISVKELAEEMGISPNTLSQQMFRLRRSLKAYLEKEAQLHE